MDCQETAGTHSILDITAGIRPEPEPYVPAASPLTQDQLLDSFGTTEPTRSQVLEWMDGGEYDTYITRGWWAVYVISYQDGKPDGLHFGGISGD